MVEQRDLLLAHAKQYDTRATYDCQWSFWGSERSVERIQTIDWHSSLSEYFIECMYTRERRVGIT